MKKVVYLAVLAMFLLAAPSVIQAQDVDITGAWIGETYVPDAAEPDKLTLVFGKKDGKWTGTFSDTMGYASEAECQDIKIDGHTVTLYFEINDGYDVQTIYVTLQVEEDSMTGAWENEAGEGAEIKLSKKK